MKQYFDYLPARLVEAKNRWYVEYHQQDPHSGKRQRFREYNDLNRIKDITERRRKGQSTVMEINTNLLPYGYPFIDTKHLARHISLQSALELAAKIKTQSDRIRTNQTYESVIKALSSWISDKGLSSKEAKEFTYREAIDFMDHILFTKKIMARTYNNYRQILIAVWNELIERGYLYENPWSKVKKKKPADKIRRMLSDIEAQAILNHTSQHNHELCLAILLLHYCFIRPGEQRQLKIKNFDLVNGFIHLPGTLTKNKQNSIVTIPKSILHTIDNVWPHQLQANDYLFGGKKMIGANRLNNLHTTIVNQLHKKGIIEDTTGISIYSWKDTGAMSLIKAGINPYDIMSQMRHSELSTTMKYLKSLSTVNKDVQNLIATMLPTIS